jgi:FAD/FMN-containing dehydrogenase
MRGELIAPRDDGYDAYRTLWNTMIDRRPACIARCRGAADVVAAISFAREFNLLCSVRGGGHNVAGKAIADDALMIDLSPMQDIRVDPSLRRARVGAGCLWSAVDAETQAFGLATTGGTVSHTGVAGLTLGGGIGWLGSIHGTTCDNLLSVDLVTAQGDYLRVHGDDHPDLFWALRGGGGNFGVATSFEFQLHPVGPMIYAGLFAWPMTSALDVLRAYRDFVAEAPETLTVFAGFISSPEGDPLLALIPGWFGPLEEGESMVAPLRKLQPALDAVQPIPYAVQQQLFDEAAGPGMPRYWKSGYITELSDSLIDVLIEQNEKRPTPESPQLLFRMHGRMNDIPADATAFPQRRDGWDYDVIAQWTEPQQAEPCIAWARETWEGVSPHTDGVYINHLDHDDDARIRAAYGSNYDRLAEIKRKYDADNFFRLNNNIPPGAPP